MGHWQAALKEGVAQKMDEILNNRKDNILLCNIITLKNNKTGL